LGSVSSTVAVTSIASSFDIVLRYPLSVVRFFVVPFPG